MKPAYTPGTLTVPPRRVAAIAWRSALPLLPPSFTALNALSNVLSLAKPTASMEASASRAAADGHGNR